jgi:hypothetical protein
LHSPLHTPKRKPRDRARTNLVSASIGASTAMSGPEVDPKTLSAADKLDFLITQVASLTDLGAFGEEAPGRGAVRPQWQRHR